MSIGAGIAVVGIWGATALILARGGVDRLVSTLLAALIATFLVIP